MLDCYTKAEFPLEVPFGRNGLVRLLASDGVRVVGVTLLRWTDSNGDKVERFSQVLDWDGQGVFGRGGYPQMDLAPPPAAAARKVAEMESEIDEISQRLAAHPDAPTEWRERDEERIKVLRRKIETIAGEA